MVLGRRSPGLPRAGGAAPTADLLTDEEWEAQPLRWVRVSRLRFGYHDVAGGHVDRWLAEPRWPPLRVTRYPGGLWVHDGRHRAVAARHGGRRWIRARVEPRR